MSKKAKYDLENDFKMSSSYITETSSRKSLDNLPFSIKNFYYLHWNDIFRSNETRSKRERYHNFINESVSVKDQRVIKKIHYSCYLTQEEY